MMDIDCFYEAKVKIEAQEQLNAISVLRLGNAQDSAQVQSILRQLEDRAGFSSQVHYATPQEMKSFAQGMFR